MPKLMEVSAPTKIGDSDPSLARFDVARQASIAEEFAFFRVLAQLQNLCGRLQFPLRYKLLKRLVLRAAERRKLLAGIVPMGSVDQVTITYGVAEKWP